MSQRRFELECRIYSQYLTGQAPDEYVIRKYAECHAKCGRLAESADAFDRLLLDISLRGPFWTRLADTYASRFHKYSMLRKKLVLTLALLECSPVSFPYLDDVDRGGVLLSLVRLAWRAGAYAATLLLAILLFLPAKVWTAAFARNGKVPVLES